MKHIDIHHRRAPAKTNHKIIYFILGGIIFILILANVMVSAGTVASGAYIKKMEDQKKKLTIENQELEHKLLLAASINKLKEKADELGYTKPNHLETLSNSTVVAQSITEYR
jgi:hypothetical protein